MPNERLREKPKMSLAAMRSLAAPRPGVTASASLDDGDAPTLRDLTERLFFTPNDGRIWLDEQRMVLLHAASLGALRRELIEGMGYAGARSTLTRLGYASGARDAELVRKRWNGEDIEGAFTAGARLHGLEGLVKVTLLAMDYDVPRGTFFGDFIWQDSCEASEHMAAYGVTVEPVCWMRIGYACGYASAFMGKLVLYREVQCKAMGAPHCRVIGKPADAWDNPQDDLTFLNPDMLARRPVEVRTAASPASVGHPAPPPVDAAIGLVGVSAAFAVARHMLDRVAPTQASVLFVGESGVGRELFAQALHRVSPRRSKPFLAVNCAAIPETLVESELFGVEKGAYTGATAARPGRFERATGGTLFLDEIPSLSLISQGKLLRALQEREIERVGGTRLIRVDVRIVAATNRDLRAEVQAGRFREDLFYRLNVFPIRLPPLRERRDDIPLLIEHFLRLYSRQHGRNIHGLSRRAIEALLNYDYPGNIREMQNIVERGVISAPDDGTIDLHHLFHGSEHLSEQVLSVQSSGRLSPPAGAEAPVVPSLLDQRGFSLEAHEQSLYREALARACGKVAAAARLLGLTRPQLAYRLRQPDPPGVSFD